MPVVLITGGTGLIGKNLTSHLVAKGYQVIIVSRKSIRDVEKPLVSYSTWNIEEEKIEKNAIAKADYIIHLAGAAVMDKGGRKSINRKLLKAELKATIF